MICMLSRATPVTLMCLCRFNLFRLINQIHFLSACAPCDSRCMNVCCNKSAPTIVILLTQRKSFLSFNWGSSSDANLNRDGFCRCLNLYLLFYVRLAKRNCELRIGLLIAIERCFNLILQNVIFFLLHYRRLGAFNTHVSPTGKSFRFVRKINARDLLCTWHVATKPCCSCSCSRLWARPLPFCLFFRLFVFFVFLFFLIFFIFFVFLDYVFFALVGPAFAFYIFIATYEKLKQLCLIFYWYWNYKFSTSQIFRFVFRCNNFDCHSTFVVCWMFKKQFVCYDLARRKNGFCADIFSW